MLSPAGAYIPIYDDSISASLCQLPANMHSSIPESTSISFFCPPCPILRQRDDNGGKVTHSRFARSHFFHFLLSHDGSENCVIAQADIVGERSCREFLKFQLRHILSCLIQRCIFFLFFWLTRVIIMEICFIYFLLSLLANVYTRWFYGFTGVYSELCVKLLNVQFLVDLVK